MFQTLFQYLYYLLHFNVNILGNLIIEDDREALWKVLKIYGVGGQLLKGIQAFYRKANACVRVGREFSESFAVDVGVRQGCVMSP